MAYGDYIQRFGHNYGRSGDAVERAARACIVCGDPLPPYHRKFCSDVCARKHWAQFGRRKSDEE